MIFSRQIIFHNFRWLLRILSDWVADGDIVMIFYLISSGFLSTISRLVVKIAIGISLVIFIVVWLISLCSGRLKTIRRLHQQSVRPNIVPIGNCKKTFRNARMTIEKQKRTQNLLVNSGQISAGYKKISDLPTFGYCLAALRNNDHKNDRWQHQRDLEFPTQRWRRAGD